MSLLVISAVLGHFVNTLTPDYNYSLPNSENFPQPIQMQLSKKPMIFSELFSQFLNSISIRDHFKKER